VIKRVFQKRNFEVLYSLEGKDGLGLFYSEKPEIVILDLNLSDLSGFEILKTIKSHSPSCYVLMITASRIKENRERALELGADSFLRKSFDVKELEDLILGI
jgi:DNA-binding response OmpR family regulator